MYSRSSKIWKQEWITSSDICLHSINFKIVEMNNGSRELKTQATMKVEELTNPKRTKSKGPSTNEEIDNGVREDFGFNPKTRK